MRMPEPGEFVTVGDMEAMTPQQRADAVAAHTVRSWDEVPADFRRVVNETALRLGEQLRKDA